MDDFLRWALALIMVISFPFVGQVVAYLSYRLLRQHQDTVAHFVGVSIPPLVYFYQYRWLSDVQSLAGMNLEDKIFLWGGAGLQLCVSLLIQLAIHSQHKTTKR